MVESPHNEAVHARHIFSGHIQRTLVASALIAGLSAVCLFFYFEMQARQLFRESYDRGARNIAGGAAMQQIQFADKTRSVLETLQSLLADLPPENQVAREAVLRQVLAANPTYATLFVVNQEGVISAGTIPSARGLSVYNRRYWVLGKQTMRFTAGEFALSQSSNVPVLHFSLPLRNKDGEFSGMLVAGARLSSLGQYWDRVNLPPGGALLFVDYKGVRLFRYPKTPTAPEGETILGSVLEKIEKGSEFGQFQDKGFDGRLREYTFRRVFLEGDSKPYGAVIVATPVESLEAMAAGGTGRNAFIAAAVLLFFAGLSYVLGRKSLLLPAKRLLQKAECLCGNGCGAEGKPLPCGGELGSLALSLDAATASMKRHEDDALRYESVLVEEERKFRSLFDHSQELIGLLSPEGLLLKVNPAALRVAGATPEEVLGKPFWDTPWWNDDPKKQLQLKQAIAKARTGPTVCFETSHSVGSGKIVQIEFSLQAVSGDDGAVSLLIAEGRNVTERNAMEARLRHMALHDPLTGLANRALLRERIGQAQRWFRRDSRQRFAILFIDIDRFKVLNDSMGHSLGDILLQEAGARFLALLREGDTLARYGGDEFVALVCGLASPKEAVVLAKRLDRCLEEPFVVEGMRVQLKASIGIELNPEHDASSDELIRNANLAMHQAKQSRRGRPKVYTSKLLASVKSVRVVEQDLPAALRNGQLHLVFQPIVDAGRGGTLAGFEALCRWNHPDQGNISPLHFIRQAEETGFIITLGEWILDAACRALAVLLGKDGRSPEVFVSVNVSARQVADAAFASMVRDTLARYGLGPEHLHLEITETAIMDFSNKNVERLKELASLGVKLSVDDFGTGYSNLALMTKLPLSVLKIDMSLVRAMDTQPGNGAVIKAIVTMARSLGLDVVVEGVETARQRDILLELGCGLQQGYLHSRPLTLPLAETYLEEHTTQGFVE